MTDKLMIQLPLADVKRELQAAWEATRARLQPPKPTLGIALEGEHAALYQVYDRDFSQAQPVVTLLTLQLTADGQYSLLDVGTCTHDKARAWAIFEEWWLTFRERLPRAVTIMLQDNVCLSDNGQALEYLSLPVSATEEKSKGKPGRNPYTDDEWEECFKKVENVLAFKKESKIGSEEKACDEYERVYKVAVPYGSFRSWKREGKKRGRQFAE